MVERYLTIILTITGRILPFLAGGWGLQKPLVYRRLVGFGLTVF